MGISRTSDEGLAARERGALWALVQDHLDRTALSERAFARLAGLNHQTLNAWKHRELRQLPGRSTLEGLAGALGLPYPEVLDAALRDAGFVDESATPVRVDPTAGLTTEQRRVVLALVDLLQAQAT